MPTATCRCGQTLALPKNPNERIVCQKCGAKIRVRASGSPTSGPVVGDGFLRFSCTCGRRLKVPNDARPSHGKCPDCGRIVPVPEVGGGPETRTDELLTEEVHYLEQWAADHRQRGSRVPEDVPTDTPTTYSPPASEAPPTDRAEAGLRLCPRCRTPVHMGSEVCRTCGTTVPRR